MLSKQLRKRLLITLAVLLLLYVAMVALFETMLGYSQPQSDASIVIATFDESNSRHERVVRLTRIDGENYIAAQHWPRAWYNQAIANPEMEVKMDSEFEPFLAVPVEGAERAHVEDNYRLGFGFRFVTGFPPRDFLRLDPR